MTAPETVMAADCLATVIVINRNGLTYSGPLDEAKVVDRLATSCGHWGSGADYLYNTVKNLEERGIHDRHLWRLQRLVAAEPLEKS